MIYTCYKEILTTIFCSVLFKCKFESYAITGEFNGCVWDAKNMMIKLQANEVAL